MCGIFGVYDPNNQAAQKTLTALKTLEYRGYDSWGIAGAMENGQWKMDNENKKEFFLEKHVGKIGDVSLHSQFSTLNSQFAVGHTRWATHGGVTQANAHPHLDCTGRFAIVHNGIVENYAELKEELLKAGHVFKSETDSEVIAHLIEQEVRDTRDPRWSGAGKVRERIRKVFLKLRGLNAIVVLDRDTETLIAYKTGSPLVIGKDKVLASDAIALLPHTDAVHYMADGEIVVIERSSLKIFDAKTGREKQFHWTPIERGNGATELGKYAHFMLKEIHEQAKILKKLSAVSCQLSAGAKRIFFVGCGSAYFAGLYGEYLCANTGIDARAVVGSEFGHVVPMLNSDDVVIFLSQSGETIDLVEHAKTLQKKKISMIGLINREGSTLSRFCTTVIPLRAGPEQSVCATKSWFAKILVLSQMLSTVESASLGRSIKQLLLKPYEEKTILPIVNNTKDAKQIFLIGRDRNVVLALEGAMKLKEVTYIHAEAFAGGELKHGSIALIEKGTPVIVIAPHDETFDATISNAMEVKARGALIIGLSETTHPSFDYTILVAACDPWALAAIIPIQLLAYHTAVALGRDPDKPRNLAKSVTVK